MNKMNKILGYIPSLLIMCIIALSFGQVANAQVVTFAQFLQKTGNQDYVFNNNTTDGSLTTVAGGSAIDFRYQNINNLPAELQGFQDAHLFVTTTTTTPSALNGGQRNQPLDSMTTIQIIRDTTAGVGGGSRTNLLSIQFSTGSSTPSISGSDGGNSASLSAATPGNNVIFSSDFVSFGATTQRAAALSFSSVVAAYAAGTGNFLDNFTAAGTGTMSSNPPPQYLEPTAADASVGGRVFNSSGRGITRATVKMTDFNGDVRFVNTNNFGYFKFNDVLAGETYIFSVEAKGYEFSSQAVTVNDNVSDLNFNEISNGIYEYDYNFDQNYLW